MAWFLRGILHVESGVGVLFKWPRFIKDQVLWTECLSCNQDLRKETLHSTWTGRGWGHSWKNSSVPVFLSHVHQQWENKGEKHPFISSKIDRNFYTIIGLDPKCTDLVNDKLCHFLTCLTFLLHHFFETVERSQKKKSLVYFSKPVFKEEYEYTTFILDSIKKQEDYTALCMSRK